MLYTQFHADMQAHLDHSSACFVLALSGGMDSRVLLHLMGRYLKQYPQTRCRAVHVHHGLSPNADRWAEQCLQWACDAGIHCVVEHVTLELGKRKSLEEQARQARYQALAKHLQAGSTLMTAQHADDQLETVLLALKRGSGPAGLAAMPTLQPFASGVHWRPLLAAARQDIECYAGQHQLQWVDDESNNDERYDRNFLRHSVTPQLVERWPGLRKAVARSASLCGEQEALLQELLADKLQYALHPDQSLNISALGSERQAKALIRQWLSQQNARMPSQAQLEQIWHNIAMAKQDANPKLSWHQHEVRRSQERLYLLGRWPDISTEVVSLTLNKPAPLPGELGGIALVETSKGSLRRPSVDEPISIRFEPAGQVVQPVGRVGKRKLKKLFQEYGIPSWNRRRTPLLFYGEVLAAVAGVFVVEGFAGEDCDLEWHNSALQVQ
ncbi:tRNA lysidine(34) synthetase TilS [Photobacterium sanctipauli]|uniref:tRNA(Ile)-lysidine synthase n=1 Tax=Photobacterium sanctipauli TaxID=1342794 RepID=A0A2T3NE63_9GAMM|nr:tRNA lysidine(34) synthetase TilS [Photobacterium sanctipauli]PSW12660.1 tRNA lysidine(34) synthetase TilS [Photobacterium sanctipauli]